MLRLPDKHFKAGNIEILQWTTTNVLETKEKAGNRMSQWRNRRCKGEPNENFRKQNTIMKIRKIKLSGQIQHQIEVNRKTKKISELEDEQWI